jgi:YD repeat-containing protein
MKLKLFSFAVSFMIALGVTPAQAGVNLKNGNYYISYTDIYLDDGAYSMTRTYNSRASGSGWFGAGWGSELETRLQILGDGSVELTYIGSGATRIYSSPYRSNADLDAMLDTMLAAYERTGRFASDSAARAARSTLARDSEARRTRYRDLLKRGLVPAADIPVGTELRSRDMGEAGAVITRETAGYYYRSNRKMMRFDLQGNLIEERASTNDGVPYHFRLRYDAKGHLREIIPVGLDTIRAETDSHGRILSLRQGEGDEAIYTEYSYDDDGRLIRSRDMAGNVYRFDYDDRYNMTAIHYTDGSSFRIGYKDGTGQVARTVERNGTMTRYDYGDLPVRNADVVESYYTETRTYASEETDTPIRTRREEWEISADAFGKQYTSRQLIAQNGVESEWRYHACGQPTLKRRGDRMAEFDYNDRCLLTMKRQDGVETRLTYDPRSDKIATVETYDERTERTTRSEYSYDFRGNLVTASDDDGRSVELEYSGEDRIDRIIDQDGQVMRFTYNAAGKPIRIEILGTGAIDVDYDASGEIENVESDAGQAMALRVTQSFQALLSLVQPAGIDFSL